MVRCLNLPGRNRDRLLYHDKNPTEVTFDELIQLTSEELSSHFKALNAYLAALNDNAERVVEALNNLFDIDDPGDDVQLPLDEAVCLPELGGALRHDRSLSTPSRNTSVKSLRTAMARGDLAYSERGRLQFVSRAQIKEWISSCVKRKSSDQSSVVVLRGLIKRQESSPIEAHGSSTTTENTLRQAAVSAMISSMRPPKKQRN